MVYIEDLMSAFQTFQSANVRAMQFIREPAKYKEIVTEARDNFKAFCEVNDLPIDFTER